MKNYIYTTLKNLHKILFNKYSDLDIIQLLLKAIIKKKIKNKESFFFVQIGSSDGKKGDPLFNLILNYGLSGILVEPVPYLFEQLIANYNNRKNLFFENSAIGNPSQNLKFYRLKEMSNLPSWHNGLGSFKLDVILNHKSLIPDIEKLIVEENIKIISFLDLMKKYLISNVSILQIDTEGYDYEIIKSIDFDKCSIQNILFENKHLSVEDYDECITYLKNKGFNHIIKFAGDTFCAKNSLEIYLDPLYRTKIAV